MDALGLWCCTGASSRCGEQGLLFIVMQASHCRTQVLGRSGFSGCRTWAQLFHGM